MEDPSIWQDQQRARKVGTGISRIENKIKRYKELETLVTDNIEIARLAQEEGDIGLLDDLTKSAQAAAGSGLQLGALLSN